MCVRAAIAAGATPQRYVVRWDPGEGILAPYDIPQQFHVTERVAATDIPVPWPCWLETDPAVMGRDFYVVEYVEGEAGPRLLDPADPRTPGRMDSYVTTLAALHRLDWRRLGLDAVLPVPFTRPAVAVVEKTDRFIALIERDDDVCFYLETRAWLVERALAGDRLVFCHGDVSLSNYLFDGTDVVAVVDWELACLSDPMLDVAFYCNLLFRYRTGATEDAKLAERASFVARYEKASGVHCAELPYWEALIAYRNAVMSSQPMYAAHYTTDYRDRLAGLVAALS